MLAYRVQEVTEEWVGVLVGEQEAALEAAFVEDIGVVTVTAPNELSTRTYMPTTPVLIRYKTVTSDLIPQAKTRLVILTLPRVNKL
jgi:hypothetical protein